MRRKRRSIEREQGFTLIELLVVLTVIALALPSLYLLSRTIEEGRKQSETEAKVKAFAQVFRKVYWENLNFARRNCYGWSDPSCSTLTLTPEIINDTTLRINTIDPTAIQVLVRYGCLVTALGGNSYSVSCYDGRGRLFQFAVQNGHVRGQDYYLPYQNQMPQVTITPSLGNAFIIDFTNEITWSLAKTDTILNDIAEAVRGFVRRKRQAELGNSCGTTDTTTNPVGGLASWDDTLVPWVWKTISQNPGTLCSGIEDSQDCGCSNHATIANWETNNQFCRIDSASEWQRFLTAIGLGIEYRTDGLGNALSFVPISDANGNPVNCPPPRPRPSYSITSLIPKSRVGVFDAFLGTWYRYLEVVSE